MAENPLLALSDHVGALVERVAGATVAVHAGRSWSSGIHWRSGVIVTAEEVLERDDGIKVVLVNAQHTKNVPGRKSDVQECQ